MSCLISPISHFDSLLNTVVDGIWCLCDVREGRLGRRWRPGEVIISYVVQSRLWEIKGCLSKNKSLSIKVDTCWKCLLQLLPSAWRLGSDPGPGMMWSVWLAGGTDPASLLISWSLKLHHTCHLIVGIHILVYHQLVIPRHKASKQIQIHFKLLPKGHLWSRCSLLHLLHELSQLCPLVSNLLWEVFCNVDVTSWQKLGFPAIQNVG